MVADLAIVRDMHVGHDPIVVADRCHATILRRTRIDRAELANSVSVPDFEPRRLAGVFFVLWVAADRGELKDAIVAPDAGSARYVGMRADRRAFTDRHAIFDDRVRSDSHTARKLSAGRHDS